MIALTFTAPVQAETAFDPDVSSWIEIERPENPYSPDGLVFSYRANYSQLEWSVREEDGNIFANLNESSSIEKPEFTPKTRKFKGGYRFKKVDDGWLVAFNQGEFGAELWWFSKNGQSSYKISNDQVKQFIATDRGIYAIQGLAHMSSRRGSLIKIEKGKDRWLSILEADFKGSPSVILRMHDNAFIVVLTNSLVRMDAEFTVKKLWTIHQITAP